MENAPKQPKKGYGIESIKVMSVAFELGFIIALPIAVFALTGRWLDQKYQTGYFIYLGVIFAIIVTSIWVYRRFLDMVEKLKEAANQKEKEK